MVRGRVREGKEGERGRGIERERELVGDVGYIIYERSGREKGTLCGVPSLI